MGGEISVLLGCFASAPAVHRPVCADAGWAPGSRSGSGSGSGHGDIADVVAPKIPQVQPVPDLHGIACHVFEHVSVHVFFNVGD